jgi:hypothetical protein
MSTGLTFGTIASLYGLNARIIDRTQFSPLLTSWCCSLSPPGPGERRPATDPVAAGEQA